MAQCYPRLVELHAEVLMLVSVVRKYKLGYLLVSTFPSVSGSRVHQADHLCILDKDANRLGVQITLLTPWFKGKLPCQDSARMIFEV